MSDRSITGRRPQRHLRVCKHLHIGTGATLRDQRPAAPTGFWRPRSRLAPAPHTVRPLALTLPSTVSTPA